jgi:DNA-directed RNA polymerase specialized sigma54-like protein
MEKIWNTKIDNTTEKIIDNILDYLFDNGYIRKDVATTDNIMLDNVYSIVSKELKKL